MPVLDSSGFSTNFLRPRCNVQVEQGHSTSTWMKLQILSFRSLPKRWNSAARRVFTSRGRSSTSGNSRAKTSGYIRRSKIVPGTRWSLPALRIRSESTGRSPKPRHTVEDEGGAVSCGTVAAWSCTPAMKNNTNTSCVLMSTILTEVRHGTVDFGNFEASGRSKCRVSNGGF